MIICWRLRFVYVLFQIYDLSYFRKIVILDVGNFILTSNYAFLVISMVLTLNLCLKNGVADFQNVLLLDTNLCLDCQSIPFLPCVVDSPKTSFVIYSDSSHFQISFL